MFEAGEILKLCKRCYSRRPLGMFHRCAKNRDGLHTWCKTCQEVHRKARREAIRAQRRAANPQAVVRSSSVEQNPLTDEQRELAEVHLDYARKGARKYARLSFDVGSWSPLNYDDFLSAAYEGLIHAARKFTPARNVSFRTYAFYWIDRYLKNVMLRARRENGWMWTPSKADVGSAIGYGGMVRVMKRCEWPRRSDGTDNESRLPRSYQPTDELQADDAVASPSLVTEVSTVRA